MRLAPFAVILSLLSIAGCAPPPTPEQLGVMERIKTNGFSAEEKRVIARAFLQGIGAETLTGLWVYPVKDGMIGPSTQTALIRYETNRKSVFANADGCFNLVLTNGRVVLMTRSYLCAKNSGEESIMSSVQEAKRELAADLLRTPRF